jgi:hypothetical protein
MRNKPYPEKLSDAMSTIWMLFFFGISWVCIGLMAYGILFQWFFKLVALGYPDFHIPVFLSFWAASGFIWYRRSK